MLQLLGVAVATAWAHPPASVEFSARRVVVEPTKDRLELAGDVRLAAGRFRLRGDRFVVVRRADRISVEGEGDASLCPCASPPVTFGFRGAAVTSGDELRLDRPTVRVFGVPLLWMPELRLRSPRRAGLLPLVVAYRAADGPLLGTGVHVPVGDVAADLAVAGYTRGGAELQGRFTAPRSAATVRWDHLGTDLLGADLRASHPVGDDGAIAVSVDSLRGPRALRGPGTLEAVALREDRAAVAAGAASSGALLAADARLTAARGGPVDAPILGGPGLLAAVAGSLGRAGVAGAAVRVATLSRPASPTVTLLAHEGELRGTGRLGPVAVSAEGRTVAGLSLGERVAGRTLAGGGGVTVALPLVRAFGGERTLQHWLVPAASVTGGVRDDAGPPSVLAPGAHGGFVAALGGLQSSLGDSAGERAAVVGSLRGGGLDDGRGPAGAVVTTARAHARRAGLGIEGLALPSRREAVIVSEVRLGDDAGPSVRGRVAGEVGAVPPSARLAVSGWDSPSARWLGRPGWSAGGGVVVPWASSLTSRVDADVDVTGGVLLGIRGATGYRHPCGCLAATAWAAERLGRAGVDVWLTVELAPR